MISKLSSKRLEELALKTELQVDKKSGIIFGKRQGYDICLRVIDNTYKALLSFSVSLNNKLPQQEEFVKLTREHKFLASCNTSNYSISFIINSGLTKSKCIEGIINSINTILQFLQLNGYKNCCESCGKNDDINTYVINGTEIISCSNCFNTNTYSSEIQEEENKKNENIIAGIVGALLGSLIGVISIVIVGQLGYVASICGLIMAVCTLKGYEFLGRRFSNIGIFISSIIILIMIYIGCQLDWAISIMSYYEVDIFTAFRAVIDGYIDMSAFKGNLMLLYLFAIIGAVPTILKAIRSQKHKSITHKMESNI